MKRIALFISSLQKGGSERVMVNLAEYFYQQKYEVILITQYKKENEYHISPEIRRVYSEPTEEKLDGGRIHNFIVRFCELRDIWKSYKPDIILSFLGKNNMMAILTSAFLPTRVVVSVRGEPTMEYEGKMQQLLAKLLFRYADGVILQTKLAKKFFPKAVQKKAVVMPNPLNASFLDEQHLQCSEKEDIIVTAGRLDENKNQAMLIHAFDKIASQFPNVKVIIYGEGESRKELEKLIAQKGLEERVLMPGNISDVAAHICKAKIFVLTSNTEGMPNSIMEAMSLGIPVISTDCPCGGPATLIQNGENGMLVPVGDAYALADAMREVLTNDELAKKLGSNAAKIRQQLAPQKVNRQWENYLTMIASKERLE